MLFNSLNFLFFFLFVATLYYSLPWKYRWVLLLAASAYFYASFVPVYLLILGVVIVVDYFAGLWIERASGRQRLLILVVSLVANVGFLAFFKYFDFLNDNITAGLQLLGQRNAMPPLRELFPALVLPIGLSFHTFQSMSYTIEVYRGNQRAERHFGIYALYVLFFPQLVAGPIERPQNVLWQFREKINFNWDNLRIGLTLMTWGMFKKVVIADRLALVTDAVYADVANQSATSLLIGTFFYCFQIYCDFSGYSDIAIGAARVMGFGLMTNFNAPYFAQSVSEFWKRWHISLSTWFRDYVYIPLGGNRRAQARVYFNLLVVFLLSGLWHGSDWKFVIWGGIHGLYLVLGQVLHTNRLRGVGGAVGRWLNIVWTFGLVAFAWIFFRAASLSEALAIITKLFTPSAYTLRAQLAISGGEFLFSLVLIALLLVKDKYWGNYIPPTRPFWTALPAACLIIYLLGVFTSNQFIYFQF